MNRIALKGMVAAAVVTASLAVSACQTSEKKSAELKTDCENLSVEDCRRKNRAEIQAMIADPKNEWVMDFSDKSIVSGKRLAAFVGSADQLTCSQLLVGMIEANHGDLLLSSSSYGPADAQASLLIVSKHAKDVLEKEHASRCDGANPKT